MGFIARTAAAGEVAVHSTWAHDDLRVTSVIADPDIPPAEVIGVAHDLATRLAARKVDHLSIYELPLGETSTWRLIERTIPTMQPEKRAESYSALLPAWEAHSDHELRGRELGFENAAGVLAQVAGLPLEGADDRSRSDGLVCVHRGPPRADRRSIGEGRRAHLSEDFEFVES